MNKSLTTLFILCLSFFAVPTWAADEEAAVSQALYYKIAEPFTINFLKQSQQQARYLQIKVALKADEQSILDSADMNLPMIQDSLRSLFSEQTMESISSVEGRRQLQASTLDTINGILKEETGKGDVKAVYFTSFILQ
ncbi:flagellar basal body protein FliL [Methylophaga sp. 41_12_T18]|nr:flagellar basal body protein FliL [Methylophaga sp. 41_12_T18]